MRKFNLVTQAMINQINEILHDYRNEGFKVTLRHIFYQFVSRLLLPNNEKSYLKLLRAAKVGRDCGEIDQKMIVDGTRKESTVHRFDFAREALIKEDPWKDHKVICEVWSEKDTISGILDQVCGPLCVTYLLCGGSVSDTKLDEFADKYYASDKQIQMLYIGDHDPSGIVIFNAICRKLAERGVSLVPKMISITREQIDKYDIPPNPAKQSDSNYKKYKDEHGPFSWEVDALSPKILRDIIESEIIKIKERNRREKDS